MVVDDAMFTLLLLLPGFVLGSLVTAVVFCCAFSKPKRLDTTTTAAKESKDGDAEIVKAKTGPEPSQRKRFSDFTLEDVVYVPATGSCVHKNPRCGAMKSSQKFKLCSICFG